MIDLVSTKAGVDSQTRACAHLLACVVAQAIRDAAERPSRAENSCEFNLKTNASVAVRWLFEDNTPFVAYTRLIGLEPQAVRDALLSDRQLHKAKAMQSTFSDQDRRIIQLRYRWLLNEKQRPATRIEMIEKYMKSKDAQDEELDDVQSH